MRRPELSSARPAADGSIPSTSAFCFSEASLSITSVTACSSASAPAAAGGFAIVQGAVALARFTSATSAAAFSMRSSRALSLSIAKSFVLCSFAAVLRVSSRLTQSAPRPTAPAATTAASAVTRLFVVCFMAILAALAPLPDEQAREEQREREHVEGEELHGADLVGGEEEVVRRARPGPDRDPRLLVRDPAHRVEREVAVADEAEEIVVGEVRVADHDDARLGVAAAPTRGHRDRHGALEGA